MFIAVGTSRRRSILVTLLDHPAAMSEQELGLTLAKREQSNSGTNTLPEKAQEIHTNLYHRHLPLIEDSGLIRWNREGESIATTEHSAFEDPTFQRLLEMENIEVDEALSELANRRRRVLLAILREGQRSISKTALAREILQREISDTEPSQEAMNEILIALSHIHLPKLDSANIIEYNPKTGRVAYTNHSGVEELISLFHRPDNRFVERLDGFLGGLVTTYTNRSKNTDDPLGWPTSWSESHHG